MARPLRLEYPGALYHLTSRGNTRQPIFWDDGDRTRFLDVFARVVARYLWVCHAYCLMDNHYHLLVETPRPNLSLGMRQLNGVYTQAFNRRHDRVGHLFQGRYTAILVQKQAHLLELCRYVVLNPLRAKAVPQLDSWCWSSYRATAGVAPVPEFLTVDWVLAQFGATRSPAQAHYRAFVKAGLGDHPWGRLKGRIYLGNEVFVKEHPLPAGDLAEIPRAQRQAGRPTLEEIFRNAGPDALPKAHTEHGYRMREIAEFLHVHYATISRRLRRLEQHSSTRGPVAPSVTAATQFPVSATGDMLDCKT